MYCESCQKSMGRFESQDCVWNQGMEKNCPLRKYTQNVHKQCEACGAAQDRSVEFRLRFSPLLLFFEMEKWVPELPLVGLVVDVE